MATDVFDFIFLKNVVSVYVIYSQKSVKRDFDFIEILDFANVYMT
jgi:hypothetical protein